MALRMPSEPGSMFGSDSSTHRSDPKLLRAAVTTLWVTNKEQLLHRTQTLLDLTAPLDIVGLEKCFDPGAELVGADGQQCFDTGTILRILKHNLNHYPVASHRVRRVGASVESPVRRASWMKLRSTLQDGGDVGSAPIRSAWHLQWRRERPDGKWLITQVKCTQLMNWSPGCEFWRQ